MKKFYFLVSFGLFMLGYGQSVELYIPLDNSVYPTENYFCVGEKFNFKVDAVASSTGDYGMTAVNNIADFGLSSGSTPIIFASSGNDKFSEAIPIGFNFSFYGKTYTKVVMGSNGRLVFTNDPELENLKNNAIYTDRTFSGVTGYNSYTKLPSTDYNKIYKANPNQELNLAQIFFGYTDLVSKSANGSVEYLYKNVVVGGVNGLMVSFQNQIRTNGLGGISSARYNSTVLLLEDGRVVIYVNDKSEINYKAILGMQNDDALKILVPDHSTNGNDYNNGPWKSEGKAWLFSPNQNLKPVFKWTNNGLAVGTNADNLVNFMPNDNDVLKIEVSFVDPATGIQVGSSVSNQVIFKSVKTPIITTTSSTCAQINLQTALIPNVTYEWRKVGNTAVLSTTNQLSVTASGDYVVKIIRNGSAGLCSLDSAPISLVLNGNFPPFNNSPKFICKNDGSTQTSINLYDYYRQNFGEYTLRFQENGVDLPSPNNIINLNADQTRNIKIIAESVNTTSPCSFTDTFNVTFISLPATNTEYSPANLCFGSNNYTLANFENQNFAGKDYQFTYSTDGGVTYQNLTSVNPQNTNQVFVKIKHPNVSCETVVKLKFNFNEKILIKPYTQFPAHCFSSSEFFDLNITQAQLEYSKDIGVSFFRDAAFTKQINDLNYRGSGTVYIKIENTDTGCLADSVPQLNLIIYPKPALIKGTPEMKYSQCGTTLFNLTTNINDYIGTWTRYSEIRYYDFAGIQLSQSEWENYDFAIRKQPYMVFVYNKTNNLQCSDRIDFNLVEYKKPISLKSQILICSELNYSLQNFKNEVVNNSANYTFTDISGNPLPADFNWSTLPLTVDFLIQDNATGCISDPQTLTFTQGGNSVLKTTEIDYILCDADFDGKTSFNLDSKKSDFTNDASAIFEYFKDVDFTQPISSIYTNETAFAQTVFVRVTIPGFCPSTAKINLKVNTPTQSSTLIDKYFICYGETLMINAYSENTSWKWSTGEATQTASFKNGGNYSVELTNLNGCTYTHNFVISDENQPKIQVINQTNNSIEVIAEGGVQPYTYYFNGTSQNDKSLLNPTESVYEIQVKSATGCFGPPKSVYFIKINNAFTPNGDGKNDFWKIDNLEKMERISIVIVDRNGTKVFESNNPNKVEWDGKHNNRALPTATYWYVVSWYDPVTLKSEQRQGWILMKNRN